MYVWFYVLQLMLMLLQSTLIQQNQIFLAYMSGTLDPDLIAIYGSLAWYMPIVTQM